MTRLAAVDPAQARRDVDSILRGSRFHPKGPPRPLDALFNWLDDHLQPVWHALGKVFGPIGRFFQRVWHDTIGALPGPIALLVGIAVLVAVLVYVARVLERRAGPGTAGTGARREAPLETAAELERRADAAEAQGDLDGAVRLRFRAGLLRLEHDADAIVNRPGLTTREVRRRLVSPRFDGLADTFESVAYGGTDAAPTDVDTARRDWPVVVGEGARW